MLLISPLAKPHDQTLRDTKNQVLPILRVVCHITGRATWINAEKAKVPPLQRIGDYFDASGSPFAHYTVDPWGRIACHADEQQTPWAHGWTSYRGREGMARSIDEGQLVVPAWWRDIWQSIYGPKKVRSPLDLVDPSCRTGNDRSVAIEFIQWGNQFLLTAAQYDAGYRLIVDIRRRHGMPDERLAHADDRCQYPWLLGHEDLDPWGRGDRGGGWDPGARRSNPRFSYSLLLNPDQEGQAPVIPTPEMPAWAR